MWRFILISFGFLGWAFYELSGGGDYVPSANSLQAQTKIAKEARHRAETRLAAEVEPQVSTESSDASASETTLADAIDGALMLALDQDKLDAVSDGETVARADMTLATADLTTSEAGTVLPAGEPVVDLAGLSGLSTASVDQFRVTLATTNATDDQTLNLGLSGILGTDETITTTETTTSDVVSVIEIAVAPAPADIRQVSGNRVNMRAGPGTYFDKVDQLTRGTSVEVLESSGDGWLKLRVVETDTTGWMADWLVTASE